MTTSTTSAAQVFRLPDLGEGLTEAEIVRWLVAVGDQVVVDQSIVEVETAKSLVEVPSPYAGRVATLHGKDGEAVAVGSPLITIDAAGSEVAVDEPTTPAAEIYREEEQAGSGNVLIGYGTSETGGRGRKRRPRSAAAHPTPAAESPRPTPVADAAPQRPLVISPLVRRLARDGGIDLADVTPTGEGGVVTRSDVVRALADREKPTPSATADVQRRAERASVVPRSTASARRSPPRCPVAAPRSRRPPSGSMSTQRRCGSCGRAPARPRIPDPGCSPTSAASWSPG